jgi:cation diffusion facilitator family transporter
VTSGGVWVGVGLAWATGWWVLDPLLAFFVAANVIRAGWAVVRESVGGLMDEAPPPEEVKHIHNVVRAHLGEAAIEVHDLKMRRSAERTFIEFHLVVPGSMTVRASHALCDRLENALSEAVPGSLTQIHVEPEREAQGAGRVSGLED